MPVVLAELLAALGPWIMRFMAAHAIAMFAKFLARLGLAIATNEMVIQPLIDHAVSAWSSIPAEWQCWFATFGITKAAGIMVSGLTLITAKRVFLTKSE